MSSQGRTPKKLKDGGKKDFKQLLREMVESNTRKMKNDRSKDQGSSGGDSSSDEGEERRDTKEKKKMRRMVNSTDLIRTKTQSLSDLIADIMDEVTPKLQEEGENEKKERKKKTKKRQEDDEDNEVVTTDPKDNIVTKARSIKVIEKPSTVFTYVLPSSSDSDDGDDEQRPEEDDYPLLFFGDPIMVESSSMDGQHSHKEESDGDEDDIFSSPSKANQFFSLSTPKKRRTVDNGEEERDMTKKKKTQEDAPTAPPDPDDKERMLNNASTTPMVQDDQDTTQEGEDFFFPSSSPVLGFGTAKKTDLPPPASNGRVLPSSIASSASLPNKNDWLTSPHNKKQQQTSNDAPAACLNIDEEEEENDEKSVSTPSGNTMPIPMASVPTEEERRVAEERSRTKKYYTVDKESFIKPDRVLWPHQEEAFERACKMENNESQMGVLGGILADKMGLGKSLFGLVMANYHKVGPTLIVVQKTYLGNWIKQLKVHTVQEEDVGEKDGVSFRKAVVVYLTNQKQAKNVTLKEVMAADIVFATYEVISLTYVGDTKMGRYEKDMDSTDLLSRRAMTQFFSGFIDNKDHAVKPIFEYDNLAEDNKRRLILKRPGLLIFLARFQRVVLDEAHRIKNPRTHYFKSCMKVMAKHRWCLTGTPLTNIMNEMYSLYKLVGVPDLPEYKVWGRLRNEISRMGSRCPQYAMWTNWKNKVMIHRTQAEVAKANATMALPKLHTWLLLKNFDNPDEDNIYELVKGNYTDIYNQWMESKGLNTKHSKKVTSFEPVDQGTVKDFLNGKIPSSSSSAIKVTLLDDEDEESGSDSGSSGSLSEEEGMVLSLSEDSDTNSSSSEDEREAQRRTKGKQPVNKKQTTTRNGLRSCDQKKKGKTSNDDSDDNGEEDDEEDEEDEEFGEMEPYELGILKKMCMAGNLVDVDEKGDPQKRLKGLGIVMRKICEGIHRPKKTGKLFKKAVFNYRCTKANMMMDYINSRLIRKEGYDTEIIAADEKQTGEIMKKRKKGIDKLLIYFSWTGSMAHAEKRLKKEGIKYVVIKGSISVEKRMEAIDKFETDDSILVFLLSLKAACQGFEAIKANRVLFWSPGYCPADESQAIARCRRTGQTKEVHATWMVIKRSCEPMIWQINMEKMAEIGFHEHGDTSKIRMSGLKTLSESDRLRSAFLEKYSMTVVVNRDTLDSKLEFICKPLDESSSSSSSSTDKKPKEDKGYPPLTFYDSDGNPIPNPSSTDNPKNDGDDHKIDLDSSCLDQEMDALAYEKRMYPIRMAEKKKLEEQRQEKRKVAMDVFTIIKQLCRNNNNSNDDENGFHLVEVRLPVNKNGFYFYGFDPLWDPKAQVDKSGITRFISYSRTVLNPCLNMTPCYQLKLFWLPKLRKGPKLVDIRSIGLSTFLILLANSSQNEEFSRKAIEASEVMESYEKGNFYGVSNKKYVDFGRYFQQLCVELEDNEFPFDGLFCSRDKSGAACDYMVLFRPENFVLSSGSNACESLSSFLNYTFFLNGVIMQNQPDIPTITPDIPVTR